MMQSIYTARTGLIAQQRRMDIIANNMANLNTVGYKAVRADFKDAVYQAMVSPNDASNNNNLQRGHGALLGATMRDLVQGTPEQTGRELDLVINGDGYFAIQDIDGETVYTRDGTFAISVEDDASFLVTTDGRYVLDAGGQPINLQGAAMENIAITNDGTIRDSSTGMELGQLGVSTFINRQGLEAVGGNRFKATDQSGEAIESEAGITQGFKESSNVDVASEMVRMIRAQRAFSLASRALTTADQMDAEANQLRR